jgi:hypothetical protein
MQKRGRKNGAPQAKKRAPSSFNPLAEKGIPLGQQIRNWSQLAVTPYDKRAVDPYTRTRVIIMNGIEIEAVMHSHQFARHTDDLDTKGTLAEIRRTEQQQQRVVSGLVPGDETNIEHTLGYEQTAIDLTAYLARMEPDPYIKQVLDFGLLEDFDHLYRYANLFELLEGKKAEEIIGRFTEVTPGRPTALEHRHPLDDLRKHYDKHTVDPLSRLHALTILSGEQQTMNYYMTVANRFVEPIARSLYQEIGMIEEQHVTQYESLFDPLESWFQTELFHHYNECYMYWSLLHDETDERIRKIWQLHLEMEVEHVRVAAELLRRHEGIEAEEILPAALPEPTRFEENKVYVREILAAQIDLRTDGVNFVPLSQLPPEGRYATYQAAVNGDGFVPSEEVIRMHVKELGGEYRIETEGPNPVPELRADQAEAA